MDDIKLKQLFDDFKPTLGNSDTFLADLEKHLALAHRLRAEETRRRRFCYRLCAAACLLAFIAGSLLMWFLTSHSAPSTLSMPQLTFLAFDMATVVQVCLYLLVAGVAVCLPLLLVDLISEASPLKIRDSGRK